MRRFLIAFLGDSPFNVWAPRTERQWCDLAVSLSLLSMCERGFKRLQECWECYSDKLTEPGVYQPLLSITVKLRRGAKAQFKVGDGGGVGNGVGGGATFLDFQSHRRNRLALGPGPGGRV